MHCACYENNKITIRKLKQFENYQSIHIFFNIAFSVQKLRGKCPNCGQDVLTYSVMQSDRNSFCEDVVLNSFNKASRDEDKILDQV